MMDKQKSSKNKFTSLLNAVQLAYRKHHLDDSTIGWDELSDVLLDAICNAIGDDGYEKWIKNLRNKW